MAIQTIKQIEQMKRKKTQNKTKNTTKIIIIKIKKKLKKYKDKEKRIIPFNMLLTTIKTIIMK